MVNLFGDYDNLDLDSRDLINLLKICALKLHMY